MKDVQKPNSKPCRAEDSPAAWFAVLERARHTNDFKLAAQAQRELLLLGVKVTYRARVQPDGVKAVGHE